MNPQDHPRTFGSPKTEDFDVEKPGGKPRKFSPGFNLSSTMYPGDPWGTMLFTWIQQTIWGWKPNLETQMV